MENRIRKPNLQKMRRVLARSTYSLAFYSLAFYHHSMHRDEVGLLAAAERELAWWSKNMLVKYDRPQIKTALFEDYDIDFNHARFTVEKSVRPSKETLRRYNPREL